MVESILNKRSSEITGEQSSPSVARASACSPSELLRRVQALAPTIAGEAANAEELRRPVESVWNALKEAGYFKQFVPKAFGGMEIDFQAFIDIGLTVAEADASLGWAANFLACHSVILSHFPEVLHQRIWGCNDGNFLAPYSSAPPGTAEPVDGGYVINGRWKWGTGVMNAEWAFLAVLVPAAEGPPVSALALIPLDQLSVIDVWKMAGMCGTGSNDIAAENVFVPANQVVLELTRSGSAPGSNVYESAVFSVPLLPFLGVATAVPALGAARAMLSAYKTRLSKHVRLGSNKAQVEKVGPQLRLARADLIVASAEVLVRDAATKLTEIALVPEPDQTARRIAIRGQLAYAVALCREAAMLLNEGAGSSAHQLDSPFQRNFRDLMVISTHIVFDVDIAYELHGRSLIGLEPNSALH